MLRAIFGALCLLLVAPGHCVRSADDTTCSVSEDQWFDAHAHLEEVLAWARSWDKPRAFHVLDAFGFSCKVSKAWNKAGFKSQQYDILLDSQDDVVSRSGFFRLLDLSLQLVPGGLWMGGPPCSLMVGACQSVHMRRPWRVQGDTGNCKIRLSNLIWANVAVVLLVLTRLGRNVKYVLEQPAQSYAFKQPLMQQLKGVAHMFVVLTYVAFFDHDLAKPTHLLTNMRTIVELGRTLAKKDRLRFAERLVKRNQHRKRPRSYHCKITKADGSQGWQGQKDLAHSAAYTMKFAKALLAAWLKDFRPAERA